ncbi:RNA helicase [Sarracenia purpurea var. burkii]
MGMFSRFDECNVSPLTIKALTQAGYVQMTRVQEATLSVSHEEVEHQLQNVGGRLHTQIHLVHAGSVSVVRKVSRSRSPRSDYRATPDHTQEFNSFFPKQA